MNCQQALKNIDAFLGRSLNSMDVAAFKRHLASCPACQEKFHQEKELLAALRSLPVPPPSKDFVNRTFAMARSRHQKIRAKQTIPYWGGALAACLALWFMVVAPFSQISPPGLPIQQAIKIQLNEQRLVQVVVDAPRDMLKADVVIDLPPQLELAGFPGQREIRWNTNLRKGKNLLNLPLIAKSEGIAELITHINHENKSKELSLVMDISHDELTQTERSPSRTA
ncbi:MAG: zf-HC2 domain-containing protein [Proteobacteria bacterium]|nr:zf-HC2 domain-containing protein [Pseudomonadota bacterium]MBU1641149.1 zf-HC2 domain-containing protein [Pseudomonadota bacterium]